MGRNHKCDSNSRYSTKNKSLADQSILDEDGDKEPSEETLQWIPDYEA